MKNFLKTMIVISGVISILLVSSILLVLANKVSLDALEEIFNYITAHYVLKMVTIAISAIYGICCIIAVAFSGNINQDIKGSVVLPLKVGQVHISNQTFESIVSNVAKKYAGVKTAKVNIRMKETGISVDLFAYVLQDIVISDLTSKLQEDIKDTVLKQTTVVVETVNVKIKGVYTLNENKEA